MASKNTAHGKEFADLKVLVVEQNRAMQSVVRYMATTVGAKRVRMADSVKSALVQIRLEQPDIIIADMGRGRQNALSLLNVIRCKGMEPAAYIPVIACVTFSTERIVLKLASAGAHHVLTRPTSPAGLAKTFNWIVRDSRIIALQHDRFVISSSFEPQLDGPVEQSNICGVDDELRCLPIGGNSGDGELAVQRGTNEDDSDGSLRFQQLRAVADDEVDYAFSPTSEEVASEVTGARGFSKPSNPGGIARVVPQNLHEEFGKVSLKDSS
jgi:two-component system chemotaxis response regulator CheY